jgi:hypothetical protein
MYQIKIKYIRKYALFYQIISSDFPGQCLDSLNIFLNQICIPYFLRSKFFLFITANFFYAF